MNRQEYFVFAKLFFKQCIDIGKKKNSDYCSDSSNPFANFEASQTLGIPTEIGLMTRMMDKMMRVASFMQMGTLQVQDESVQDTLLDLANYSCYLAAYIKSKRNETKTTAKNRRHKN